MIDLPGNPAHLLEEDLSNLRMLNRALGAKRGVLNCLRRIVKENQMTRFSLLDVGTGSADIPISIVRWAQRKGISVRIVALEPHPVTAAVARRMTADLPEICVVRGDGISPPFSPGAFDFVLASQLLHHFSEDEIIALLRVWSKIARRGILVSDLIRHPLAYCGIAVLTRLFTPNEMTQTDAPLSVKRAFTLSEWKELFSQAGISEFDATTLFPFRLFALFPLGNSGGTV
jgi:SAM-dependent methyltransferase